VATPKQDLVRLLQQQPDDSSREELVRELALSVMVERGLADSDARRVVPDDEMAHRIRQWRK
jgi:predicted transcriptional regulator